MLRSEFLGALGGLGGAVTVGQAAPYTSTLRIAVLAPQSGADARTGSQLVDGVRAAVNEANDLRMLSERALLFDVLDDRNDAADATVQAGFAADNPSIAVAIGHLSSSATLTAIPIYANRSLPLIVPTVTDDRITAKGYRNVFRLPTKDSDEGGLLAAYAISTGSKTPVVVTQDGDYGPEVALGFQRRAASMKLDAAIVQMPLEKPDVAHAAEAIAAKQPDSVTLAGTVADMGPLLTALRAKGYTGRILASQGFFDAATVKTYAKEAQDLIVSTNVPYYPLAPTAMRDVQNYQARYGPLTPVAAYGYAAVQLVRGAMRRTNAFDRLTLLRSLATGGSYDTITGSYTFSGTGDPVDPNVYFYRIKDGKFAYERQAHPSGFMLK